MEIDPLNKRLYTSKGVLIKELFCPLKVGPSSTHLESDGSWSCTKCQRQLVDTSAISEEELLDLVAKEPDTCLRVDLNQENLKIRTNGRYNRK